MGTSQTSSGYRVTVFSWDGSSADTESCSSAPAGGIADLGLFQLELSGGGTVEPSGSHMKETDGCIRGSVAFSVPPGRTPVAVDFEGSPKIRWSVPG
jgi:hypothetical protein